MTDIYKIETFPELDIDPILMYWCDTDNAWHDAAEILDEEEYDARFNEVWKGVA